MNLLKNLQVSQFPAIYKQILKSVTSVRSGNPNEIAQNSAECSIIKTWRSKSLSRCRSLILSGVQLFPEGFPSTASALQQFPLKVPPAEHSLTKTVCSRFNAVEMDWVNCAPNLMQLRQYTTINNHSQLVTYKIRPKYRKYSSFKDYCSKLFSKKKKANKSAKLEILPEKPQSNEKQARATPMQEDPDSEKKKKMLCVKKNQPPPKECKATKKKCSQPFGEEVVCPNPPKLNDDMSVPYYFKKVCVRSENGKCVKYEMQRVPMPDGIKRYQSPEERARCVLPDVPIPRNEGKLVTITELSDKKKAKEDRRANCKLCKARKALALHNQQEKNKPPKEPEEPPEKSDECSKYRIKVPTCELSKAMKPGKKAKEKKSSTGGSRAKIKKKASNKKENISKVVKVKSKRVKVIEKKSGFAAFKKKLSKTIKIKPRMSSDAKKSKSEPESKLSKKSKTSVCSKCSKKESSKSIKPFNKPEKKMSSCNELKKKDPFKTQSSQNVASTCNPCKKKREENPCAQIKKKPSICQQKTKPKSSSESSLCKKKTNKASICNPCQKKTSVCDPCKKPKSSSESSLCKNLKKKASICNPCEKTEKKKPSVCNPCEKVCDNKPKSSSKDSICKNLKKKQSPCDPCQKKKDPCKTEAKDNDCSKQLQVKPSSVCDPCEKKDVKKKSPCEKSQAKKQKQGRPCPICYSKKSSIAAMSKKCPKFPFRCPGEKKCKPEVVKVPRCESKKSNRPNDQDKSKTPTSKGCQKSESVPSNTPKKCSVYSKHSSTGIRMYHKRTSVDQSEEIESEPQVCESVLDELTHSDRREENSFKAYRRKKRRSPSRHSYYEPDDPDDASKELTTSKADTEERDFRKPYRVKRSKSSSHYARSQIEGRENLFEELESDRLISKEEEGSYNSHKKKRRLHSSRHSRSDSEVPEVLLEELGNDKVISKGDKEEEGSNKLYKKKWARPSSDADIQTPLLEESPQSEKIITKPDTEEESSSTTPRRKWGRSKYVRSKTVTSDTVFEEVTESDRMMPKSDIEERSSCRKTSFSKHVPSQQDASDNLLSKQVEGDKRMPKTNKADEDASETLSKRWRKSTSQQACFKPVVSDTALDKTSHRKRVEDDECRTLPLTSVKKKNSERASLNKRKYESSIVESRSSFRKLKREKQVGPCSKLGSDRCSERQSKSSCKSNIVCNPKLKKPSPCCRAPIIAPDDIVFSKRYKICEDTKELINKPVKCASKACGATKTCPKVVPSSTKSCKPIRRQTPVRKCAPRPNSPKKSEPELPTEAEPKHRRGIITNTICIHDKCRKKTKATERVCLPPSQPIKKTCPKIRSRSEVSPKASKLSAKKRVCSDPTKATFITRFGARRKRSNVKQNVGKCTKGHVFGPLKKLDQKKSKKKLDQKKSKKQLVPQSNKSLSKVEKTMDTGIITNLRVLMYDFCKVFCPIKKVSPKKDPSKSSVAKPSSPTSLKKSASKAKPGKKSDQNVAKSKSFTNMIEKKSVQAAEKHDKIKEKKNNTSSTMTAPKSLCPFSKRARREKRKQRWAKMTDRKKQKTGKKNDS